MSDKLKFLLTQYVKRRITSEELSELKAIVNLSDDELDASLRNIYIEGEYPQLFPSKRQQKRMIRRIEQATRPVVRRAYRRFARTFLRIAAVFILLLWGGMCLYLYQTNQKLTVYKDNEIVLSVGNGQEARFTLPDGTSVRLNAGSTLRYANNFGEQTRVVGFSGEAFFEVKQDKERPFVVNTKHIDIEVVGTTFNVYAFDDGDLVEMTLLTGSVKATSKKNPAWQVLVKPNEKVICDIATGKLSVLGTNTRYETAWLSGECVFKSEKLSDVLSKLERKYGVHIRYDANPNLLSDRFSGRISKDSNIGAALKIVTKHYSLKYEWHEDAFIISGNDF